MKPGSLMVRRYVFFDREVELHLPAEAQEVLLLLYGPLAVASSGADPFLRVVWEEVGEGRGRLRVGDDVREVGRDALLLQVQDVIQNRVLPAVQSHLLWHGAVWRAGDGAIILLGDSGVGKTTLSLAEQLAGGEVWSDEIAAWDPVRGALCAFPRAMAVRPDSLRLTGHPGSAPRVVLDEEKAMVPLRAIAPAALLPLRAVVLLEWPLDITVEDGVQVTELRVEAVTGAWQDGLAAACPGVVIEPHPDGGGWWRCRRAEPLRAEDIDQAMRVGRAVLSGAHREARRAPTYRGPPIVSEVDPGRAAASSLAYAVNARALADASSNAQVLAMARAALRRARCVACVPGMLEETRQAIRRLA